MKNSICPGGTQTAQNTQTNADFYLFFSLYRLAKSLISASFRVFCVVCVPLMYAQFA